MSRKELLEIWREILQRIKEEPNLFKIYDVEKIAVYIEELL